MTFSIPLRPTVETSLQASKWQKVCVLIDVDEMQSLLTVLGSFWIVRTSGLLSIGEEIINQDVFLEVYEGYIQALKQGKESTDSRVRPYFSSVWTTSLEALYCVKVNEKQSLIKVHHPVVQLQGHRFDYSVADGSFRSMVMGCDSVSWGIQFSYPHLYQNERLQVLTVRESPEFPNTSLFKKLQQWVRLHTTATPFEVEGKKVNVPIRLGKNCFSWINQHSQLQVKGLRVSCKC